jgi:hypothetical protein
MYDDCNIRIKRLQNGYNVSMTDPEIVKQNKARDKGGDGCCSTGWQDPDVSYAFSEKQEVIDFISKNIDKALPDDEFSSSFDKAAKETSK